MARVVATTMAMITAMSTSTEAPIPAATLLRLMWLASPALPVGGFSYSEGLESAVDHGLVGSEAAAAGWLADQLQLSLARSDLPLVAQAHAAWSIGDAESAAALNDWVRHSRESSELRAQTEQMGRSLLDWLRNGGHASDARLAQLAACSPAPTWPLAFALAGVLAGAGARETLLAFGFGWCENMVQAAMKAVPLGQAAAQRVLAQLAAQLPQAVEQALVLPAGERQAFAPMLAILSAQHETQYSRLFRS